MSEKGLKVVDNFIGYKTETPKGGLLTVIEVLRRKGKTTMYLIECSICSKDIELFPQGTLITSKSNLKNGCVPCGCAKIPKWSKEQLLIRVKRVCEELDYTLLGVKGSWKGVRSKLQIKNNKTGNVWDTTDITHLFSGRKDPKDGHRSVSTFKEKPTQDHIEVFNRIFNHPYEYTRLPAEKVEGKYVYKWKVYCPLCAKDLYSKEGVSDGYFITELPSLRAGIVPCRCSGKFTYSENMMKVRLMAECENYNKSFRGFKGNYCNTNSRFNWVCNVCKHEGSTEISRIRERLKSCKGCHKKRQLQTGFGNGFFLDRVEEQDLLYVIRFKGTYLKCGRAFVIKNRIKDKKGLLKKSGCTRDQLEILHVYTGTHQEVYDTEQFVIDELTERGFYYKTWTRETFSLDSEQLMINLIENHSTLTKVEYREGM